LSRLANVELAHESPLTADEILSYDFDHVAVATGARWRADGVGRWHTRPLELDRGPQLLTPDELLDGSRPEGDRVAVYDDDHYYMGGVLAELLAAEGRHVTLLTPAARASEWTTNTLEQERIQRRLLELGVVIETARALAGITPDGVRTACVYTAAEEEVACHALVLVTARLPVDGLAADLAERAADWAAAGLVSVETVGDARAPGTIAAAVWDGRRYAEELEQPERGEVPFRREVVRLAPAQSV
jgi:dimethylamine/trimethylamine dehydrogenase